MSEIIVCGTLCNNDIALAELLCRFGFDTTVVRQINQPVPDESYLPGELKYFSYNNVHYFKSSIDVMKKFSKAKLIISINGYYPSLIGLKNIFYKFIKNTKNKVINLTCGSDITEFVISNSPAGLRYRKHLKNSWFSYISPYPFAVKSLNKINLNSFNFFRFNYFLLSEKYYKDIINLSEELVFFHPSNIDWGASDNSEYRNSTKGNNRFITAFIRALDNGLKAKCIMLYRGADRKLAKDMIENSKYRNKFEFKEELTPAELKKEMSRADIIVDQFDVGGFGGIAMEAMAQAKPVMIYIDKDCWPLVYDNAPPVINCNTENEIYHEIMEWSNRQKLQSLGEIAEQWVRKYHDVHTSDFPEFILRVCLATGIEWPRKDLAKSDGDV